MVDRARGYADIAAAFTAGTAALRGSAPTGRHHRASDPASDIKVIGLSGYARTGKSTLAHILAGYYQFERIAFADTLRDVVLLADPRVGDDLDGGVRLSHAVESGGWEWAKDTYPEVRRLLQTFGVAAREVLDPDVWVQAALRKMRPGGRYVIPDVRFPNELDAVRNLGGLTVRLHRPGRGPVNDHQSETAIDDAEFDVEVWNSSGLRELRRNADRLVSELLSR